jgi:tetratricopeptide (TPR) repeat protein
MPDPRLASAFEQLALREDFEEIGRRARALLATQSDPRTHAFASYYLGLSLLRLGRPQRGLQHLRQARRSFEKLGGELMVIRCMDLEAGALTVMEDPAALTVARSALRRLDRLPGPDRPIRAELLARLGTTFLALHEWSRAIILYESSLEERGSLRDLRGSGRLFNDLSIAHLEMGDTEVAVRYARRAVTVHSRLEDRQSLARALNNLGLALARGGELAEAGERLQESLRLCEALRMEWGLVHVLISLGELESYRGAWEAARRHLVAAIEQSERTGERMTLATAKQWLGRVAALSGDVGAAEQHFQVALGMLRELGTPARLAECHAFYADALELSGDVAAALRQWRASAEIGRAARPGPDPRPP